MRQELADKLVAKYPTIFKNIDGDYRETAMCWGFMVGDGWYDLIDRLCSDLVKLDPNIVASQVKEKFGGLRFYVDDGTTEEAWNRINRAEEESYKTCETCGKPAENLNFGGWIRTLCESCISDKGQKS